MVHLLLCLQLLQLPWSRVPGSAAWTATLTNDLVHSNLPDFDPKGIEDFVPDYPRLTREQRIEVWANLIAIDAKYESDWKPDSIYHEPPPLSVDSIGLLQLSYEDEGPYLLPVHLSRENRDLENPLINLQCGVAIMEQLEALKGQFVGKDAEGNWTGLSIYWSTLRNTVKSKGRIVPRRAFREIREYMRSLDFGSGYRDDFPVPLYRRRGHRR